ncbi:coniferyl aldehyde dehydrogenase [Stutzerimonas chloritidismutans]|uniref:coniferyl aldehyde dehydrogenase n=1 Tax=Stutzerimonas chloritidismutans TaxID=203192 RepID=UPI003F135E6A
MLAEISYLDQTHLVIERLPAILERQRKAFAADPHPSSETRLQWLEALHDLLATHQQAIVEAISQDFGHRNADETRLAEIMPSLHGIRHAQRHLRRWMKPSRRRVGLAFQPASARVIYQPLGIVGIIVPWNYPLYLAIGPMIGALAAGNRIMLKMSEATPVTGMLLKGLLGQIFAEDQVAVVLGEADVAIAFSRLPFDHLLFTGSTRVGRQVMRAAADNLTPVTLELGGKSPAIVSADVPLEQAAERIAFGKMLNAGQTCVAPDYVLVPRQRLAPFIEAYRQAVRHLYPSLVDNPDYTSIVNQHHADRLQAYLDDARAHGARILPLHDEGHGRRMPPCLVLDVNDQMTLMQDEIFGPLLPVVPYDGLDEALAYVNARARPLALYYFGYGKAEQRRVLHETHAGGVCLNDTLLHVAQDDLPFGGIGPSGMGHYHGREGFLTFSKAKGVFARPRLNSTRLIYPPYGRPLQRLITRLFVR